MLRKQKCLPILFTFLILVIVFLAGCTPEYTVELKVEPEGAGEVTGEGTYKRGKDIAVKAKTNEGYQFVKWKEDGQKISSSWNYPFVVREDRVLVAKFEEIEE